MAPEGSVAQPGTQVEQQPARNPHQNVWAENTWLRPLERHTGGGLRIGSPSIDPEGSGQPPRGGQAGGRRRVPGTPEAPSLPPAANLHEQALGVPKLNSQVPAHEAFIPSRTVELREPGQAQCLVPRSRGEEMQWAGAAPLIEKRGLFSHVRKPGRPAPSRGPHTAAEVTCGPRAKVSEGLAASTFSPLEAERRGGSGNSPRSGCGRDTSLAGSPSGSPGPWPSRPGRSPDGPPGQPKGRGTRPAGCGGARPNLLPTELRAKEERLPAATTVARDAEGAALP
ncbi:translation initiation factor IF-2-like [Mustela putorius furo]|uniref:Translation initiation factor IF-2-like n=1 Tax=Mustela putorius furo TaxID=9669 RepID=A0A8U0UY15_MUSPF|nr:translation initiation factor IF-2-like [Mustela putorius furo]